MNRLLVVLLMIVQAVLTSCCGCPPRGGPPLVDLVAVRERQLRSERYPLPLTAEARGHLLMYLAAGGDRAGLDDGTVTTMVYPDAEQRWGDLLTALQNSANVDDVDLTNGTFKKWFPDTPIRQIVDATAERPNLACPPWAVRQDRFIWIFECGSPGKLGKVFVQINVAKREEK